MNNKNVLNILDLPKNLFEKREVILNRTIEIASRAATQYITRKYENAERLEIVNDFINYDLIDAAPSDFDSFNKLKLFPWAESSKELEKSLTLIVLSLYKNSLDSMRRALELIIVGSFFILENQTAEEATAWLKSNKKTPQFRKMIKEIIGHQPYTNCESECSLSTYITSLYHKLSDYIHVKGLRKSQREFHPSTHSFDGVESLVFNEKSCKLTLDLVVQTTQTIALICALTTPRLLIGFDLERKFGLNPPLSGFFEERQAERLQKLIPTEYYEFIARLRANDPNLKSLEELFSNLPDISDEDFNKQCEEFKRNWSNKI
ncbi:hypothetical protein [Solidesulfovibrio sp.]